MAVVSVKRSIRTDSQNTNMAAENAAHTHAYSMKKPVKIRSDVNQ